MVCIYCSSRIAYIGNSDWGSDTWEQRPVWWMFMQAKWIPTCLVRLFHLTPIETMLSLSHGPDPMLNRTLCVQFPGYSKKPVSNVWWTKEECASMCDNNCHWTCAADDTHIMVVSQCPSELMACLPCPAHGFISITDWFPRCLFSWGISTEKDQHQLDLKHEALTAEAKNSSWILRSGWMTLRISIFKSDVLLGQPSLIPNCWWHS